MSEQLPDKGLACQLGFCSNAITTRREATVAVDGYVGGITKLACDACAVREMAGLGPELGFRIISLDDWRARMQPQLDDILRQLRQAKAPRLPSGTSAAAQAALPSATEEQVNLDEADGSAGILPPPRQDHHYRSPMDPRPSNPVGGPVVQKKRHGLVITACCCVAIGLILLLAGGIAHHGGTVAWGVVIAVVFPILVGVWWVIAEVIEFTVDDARKYSGWKKTLPLQQRAAVNLAEAGLLWEAHRKFKERNRAERERITDSIVHGSPESRARAKQWQQRWDQQNAARQQPGWGDPGFGPQPRMWRQPGDSSSPEEFRDRGW